MMNTLRRSLALLLCLILCLGLAPAVYAEGAVLSDPEVPAMLGTSAAYIAIVGSVGCRTMEEVNTALLHGGTVKLTSDATEGELVVEDFTTLDLNGHVFKGTLKKGELNAAVTLNILDSVGTGEVVQNINVPEGMTLRVYGGLYHDDRISMYLPSDYTLKKEGSNYRVVPKDSTAADAIAVVNGTEYYSAAVVNEALAKTSATVKLNKDFEGDIFFEKGGTLDLNSHKLNGNVVNGGSNLNICDSGNAGEVTGMVDNSTGDSVSITGGKFGTAPASAFIADGYALSADNRVLPVDRLNVARIGTAYYATLDSAIEAARKNETIIVFERSDLSGDYTISKPIQKNLTLNLGNNGVEAITVSAAELTVSNGFIQALTAQDNAKVNVSGTRFAAMPTLADGGKVSSDVPLSAVGYSSFIKNLSIGLKFKCGQSLSKSKAVYVNDTALAAANFTIDPKDSTVIILEGEYLDTLAPGSYTLRLLTGRDEYACADFEVLAGPEITIENSPYKKGSTALVKASPIVEANYSNLGYSDRDDGSNIVLLTAEDYSFSGNTLTLTQSFLNARPAKTWYLYGYYTEATQYVCFGSFEIQYRDPVITRQPVSQSVGDGNTATFTVEATGEGLKYQWLKRPEGESVFLPILNATGSSLSVRATVENSGCQYRCRVTTSASVESEIVQLTVETSAPRIVFHPVSESVKAGVTASFSVTASGGNLSYSWFFRLSGAEAWTRIPEATGDTLEIVGSLSNNGSEYRCEVSNDKGTATSNAARLTVTAPAWLDTPVLLSAQESVEGGVVTEWLAVDFAEFYRVYRLTEGIEGWVNLGDTAETSYTDTTVETGKTYRYKLRCVSGTGAYTSDESNVSDPVTVVGEVRTVSFVTNGGNAIPALKVIKDSKAPKPEEPTKNGFWFIRWYRDRNLTTAFDFNTPINANLTLYARWEVPLTPPANLTRIGTEAFAGDSFFCMKLPEKLKQIDSRAFAGNANLSRIYIPAATVSIAGDAFDAGSDLTILGVKGSAAETYAKAHGFTFQTLS